MRRIIARVGKRFPVANLENLCFESSPLDDETFDYMLVAQQGRIQHNRKQKMVASWILSVAVLTQGQRMAACTALGELVVSRKSRRFDIGAVLPSRESGVLLSVATGLILALAIVSPEAAAALGAICFYIGIYPCMFLEAKLRRDVAVPAQAAISKMKVRESVDILAGLWMGGYDRVNARSALYLAFQCLTEDDYGRMDTRTLPRVLLLLEWYTGSVGRKEWNVDRAMNLLRGIEMIGDKRAIPPVRRLINRTNEPMAIRELAAHVSAKLEERDRQEEMRGVLLRGSSVTASEASLLRPNYDTTDNSDPVVLVRPTETDVQN